MKTLVDILWGYHVLFLIFLTGLRLSIRTSFFQIRKFPQVLKTVFKKEKAKANEITAFQALTTSLAGTIGTGNIVGVGLAISVGGAGAIFWMWVSALFGMMTVFTEIILSVKYKTKNTVGAFSYIEKIGKKKTLAFIYGIGCVFSCLAMGNMAQANSVSAALNSFGVPKYLVGVFLSIFFFILCKNGLKSVVKLTEKLVPFMTIFFFVLSIAILIKSRAQIPFAINEILENAFSLKAGLGGGIFVAVKVGISRGVFTNEAGLGLSSMAFSNVKNKTATQLGYMGIFQVFLDTTVMCSITALCILSSTGVRNGDYLVITAFESAFGEFGLISINICMALFAFATMTATSYYGKMGLSYISRDKLTFLFPYLFGLAAFVGSLMTATEVFDVCDMFNGLMAIPNIIAITLLMPKITKQTKVSEE